MKAGSVLATYVAGLALVLAVGYALGDHLNHGRVEAAADLHGNHADGGMLKDHGEMHANMDMAEVSGPRQLPEGLAVSEAGYTLDLPQTVRHAGKQRITFRILRPDGEPVTSYQTVHNKTLHLIAVRRDFAGFQHVHPVLDRATGTWSVHLDLTPGAWRLFADFVPGSGQSAGQGRVLASDLAVAGDRGTRRLPAPRRTAEVDGYRVTVAGNLVAGEHSMLDFHITSGRRPVANLQPYLGAYGHLVTLREGDLAYLHAHPSGEPGDGVTRPGPDVGFGAEVPTAGRYHLFLDFRARGMVHTAAFTLDAAAPGAGSSHDHH